VEAARLNYLRLQADADKAVEAGNQIGTPDGDRAYEAEHAAEPAWEQYHGAWYGSAPVMEPAWKEEEDFLPGQREYHEAYGGPPTAYDLYLTSDPVAGAIPAADYLHRAEAARVEAEEQAAYAAYLDTLAADAAGPEPEAGQ
jgi:hypothetical protein